jgi:predicted ATPase
MAFLADAYFADGQMGLANTNYDSAIKIGRDSGERWAEAEILRLHGELLAGEKKSPSKLATSQLENAIEVAHEQGSRSLELRATMSLARIASRTANSSALKRLSDIYLTFSDGLSTADLVDAKNMLTPRAR